jgi:Tfp pilus assembly pilus retraction ATPase PilT
MVRLRIDGVLHTVYTLPTGVHPPIVSRVKMLSRIDISEKRRPQDGRIKTERDGREIELRVSTLPTAFGEKVVIRIFDPETLVQDIAQLGFDEDEKGLFESWIDEPHGLILVTGPTGSGKTTTLYSALKAVAGPDVNVTTIEDPIEMVWEGFNQVQVQPKIDLDFANALRHILRQDPDVIMVGEIRDGETAENAIQAALTGHLVLSTLHTNDAVGAVSRMKDLGVPPFLLSSCLLGVMAQRLLRRVCSRCAQEHNLTQDELLALGAPLPLLPGGVQIVQGAGCVHCRGTGFYGRAGVLRDHAGDRGDPRGHRPRREHPRADDPGPQGGDAHPARGGGPQARRQPDRILRGGPDDRQRLSVEPGRYEWSSPVRTAWSSTSARTSTVPAVKLLRSFPPRTKGSVRRPSRSSRSSWKARVVRRRSSCARTSTFAVRAGWSKRPRPENSSACSARISRSPASEYRSRNCSESSCTFRTVEVVFLVNIRPPVSTARPGASVLPGLGVLGGGARRSARRAAPAGRRPRARRASRRSAR